MEILGFVVTADVSGLTQMNADKIHLRPSAYIRQHRRLKLKETGFFTASTGCNTSSGQKPGFSPLVRPELFFNPKSKIQNPKSIDIGPLLRLGFEKRGCFACRGGSPRRRPKI